MDDLPEKQRLSISQDSLNQRIGTILSAEDQSRLMQRIEHGSQADAERAKIVMLRAQGFSREQVARKLGCSLRRVSTWSSRFRQMGIRGLEERPRRQPSNHSIPPRKTKPTAPLSQEPLRHTSWESLHFEPEAAQSENSTPLDESPNSGVTMRMVAQAAGVCKMSVSRVLNNHPNVSDKLREQVLKAVRETGYRPNPEIGKLMAQLRPQRIIKSQGTICSLESNYWESVKDSRAGMHFRDIVTGARERAESLGFIWTTHSLESFLARPAHLAKVLYHRGIEGIFLPPPPLFFEVDDPGIFTDTLWRNFAVVSATHAYNAPIIQKVVHNHFQNMLLACNELARRGYRRIGLAILQEHDKRGYHHYSGAYYSFHLSSEKMLRPFFYRRPLDADAISRWYEQEQPDALIVSNYFGAHEITECLGLSYPGSVPIAALSLLDSTVAGIDELPEKLGSTGIDILSGLILRNQKGLTTHSATMTMVPGAWREGPSVPGKR